MARPEKAIDYTVPEVGSLARYLRALRAAAGLTYAELSEKAWFSQSYRPGRTCSVSSSSGVR